MKIYYQLPDCKNELDLKLMELLYENFKLKMMWKLRSVEQLMKNENGCIFIDRVSDLQPPVLRYEGFSDKLVIIMKGLLGGIETEKVG